MAWLGDCTYPLTAPGAANLLLPVVFDLLEDCSFADVYTGAAVNPAKEVNALLCMLDEKDLRVDTLLEDDLAVNVLTDTFGREMEIEAFLAALARIIEAPKCAIVLKNKQIN